MLVLEGSASGVVIITWIQHPVAYTWEHGNPSSVRIPYPCHHGVHGDFRQEWILDEPRLATDLHRRVKSDSRGRPICSCFKPTPDRIRIPSCISLVTHYLLFTSRLGADPERTMMLMLMLTISSLSPTSALRPLLPSPAGRFWPILGANIQAPLPH